LKPVRILIVDSNGPWRNVVRSILASEPALRIVGECSDGADAVQKNAKLQPNLVLLDIQLPGTNGFIAAQRILKTSPDVKILFMSEHGSLEVLRQALKIGTGLIAKTDAGRYLRPMIWAIVRNEPIHPFKPLDNNSPNASEI